MNPIRRIARVLAAMSVLPEAAGTATDKVCVSSTQTKADLSAPRYASGRPLLDEWVDRFNRLALAAERDLAAVRNGAQARERADGRDARIRENYSGDPAEFVAWIEGCSFNHVRRVRQNAGLHPATGRRTPAIDVDPSIEALMGEED